MTVAQCDSACENNHKTKEARYVHWYLGRIQNILLQTHRNCVMKMANKIDGISVFLPWSIVLISCCDWIMILVNCQCETEKLVSDPSTPKVENLNQESEFQKCSHLDVPGCSSSIHQSLQIIWLIGHQPLDCVIRGRLDLLLVFGFIYLFIFLIARLDGEKLGDLSYRVSTELHT